MTEYFLPVSIFMAGILVTFVHHRSSMSQSHIESVIDQLLELDRACIQYWSQDATPNDAALEAQIKIIDIAISTTEPLTKKHIGGYFPIFEEKMLQIYNASTGGDFETASRKSDISTVIIVKQLVWENILILRESKFFERRLMRKLENSAFYFNSPYKK